jgi:hypothetical protein
MVASNLKKYLPYLVIAISLVGIIVLNNFLHDVDTRTNGNWFIKVVNLNDVLCGASDWSTGSTNCASAYSRVALMAGLLLLGCILVFLGSFGYLIRSWIRGKPKIVICLVAIVLIFFIISIIDLR